MQTVLENERSKSFIETPVSFLAGYCIPAIEEAIVASQNRNHIGASVQVIDDRARPLNMESATDRR